MEDGPPPFRFEPDLQRQLREARRRHVEGRLHSSLYEYFSEANITDVGNHVQPLEVFCRNSCVILMSRECLSLSLRGVSDPYAVQTLEQFAQAASQNEHPFGSEYHGAEYELETSLRDYFADAKVDARRIETYIDRTIRLASRIGYGRSSKPPRPVSLNYHRDQLPAGAPQLYQYRPDRSETPIDFYKRVWGEYHDRGVLYQDDLRRFDAKLLAAIRSYCQNRKLVEKEHLPPPKSKRLDKLLASSEPGTREFRFAQRAKNKREHIRRRRSEGGDSK